VVSTKKPSIKKLLMVAFGYSLLIDTWRSSTIEAIFSSANPSFIFGGRNSSGQWF
jgi:hypothetical protein